jgi:anthranilate synthase component II
VSTVLLIDNYDSFTWNLVHLVAGLATPDHSVTTHVIRNDAWSVAQIAAWVEEKKQAGENPSLLLSPGPCTPTESGVCLEVLEKLGSHVPIFGVCLGMQAMGQAFGGRVIRAPEPMHGKVSQVTHDGSGIFRGVPSPFEATRYHSLIVEKETCPEVLRMTAETDGLIMAVQHRTFPMFGVQFHPESILSQYGAALLANFLREAHYWHAS